MERLTRRRLLSRPTVALPLALGGSADRRDANVRLALDPTGDAWATWDHRRSAAGSGHLARVGSDGTIVQTPVEGVAGTSPDVAVGLNGPLWA